jgi:F-type H+-transporting ATPase subunit b
VNNNITEARKKQEDADKLLISRDEELKSSSEEIRHLIRKAKKDAGLQADQIIKDARTHERTILKETEEQVEIIKSDALKDIESDVAYLVSELTAKIIGNKIDAETDKLLIDKLLKEDN